MYLSECDTYSSNRTRLKTSLFSSVSTLILPLFAERRVERKEFRSAPETHETISQEIARN